LEDFALMRVLPNLKVVCPVDALEARKATRVFAEKEGPMYMRTSRAAVPVLTKDSDSFIIGEANVMREGKDVTIFGCGVMVWEALQAAEMLKKDNIDAKVVNMHTIKPIDEKMIIDSARETGAIVSAEEHQINGGLGSAIAEVLVRNHPVPMEMVAVNDSFGESGKPDELLIEYHLKDTDIAKAAKAAVKRKLSISITSS